MSNVLENSLLIQDMGFRYAGNGIGNFFAGFEFITPVKLKQQGDRLAGIGRYRHVVFELPFHGILSLQYFQFNQV